MKNFTASVRLSRWQSNREPRSGWTLEVMNGDNMTTLLQIKLDNDAIANLLSSQSAVGEADLFDQSVHQIGYKRENSRIYVDDLRADDWDKEPILNYKIMVAMDEQGVSTADGWDFKIDPRWNQHYATGDGYIVHVYRWVPAS